MEELSTQQATQPTQRPSRHRSISVQDQSDVVCILHPTSPKSCRMVENIARTTPQHILQNSDLMRFIEDDVSEPTDLLPTDSDTHQHAAKLLPRSQPGSGNETHDLDVKLPPRINHGLDIALRLSSHVRDPSKGFTFGRLPIKSDIVLLDRSPQDSKVSGVHFRIYISQGGILMLQDLSTNGTCVDDIWLRCKTAPPGDNSSHIIHQASQIEVHDRSEENIRFVVSIPDRGDSLPIYQEKLSDYLALVEQLTRQAAAVRNAKLTGNALKAPVIPTNPLRNQIFPQNRGFENKTNASLTAGSERFNCGMRWNGGDKYEVVSHIGQGTFANVYKLATKREGHVVAVKEVEKRRFLKNGIVGQTVDNELKIMKTLHHSHIVEFVDFHETKDYLYIMMEFIPGGDLRGYMNKHQAHEGGLRRSEETRLLPEKAGRSVTRQLCHALDYLHKSGITHRDLKPDNILIANGEPLTVKLSDFGLSKVVKEDGSVLKTFCGTLLYCAPEVYPDYQRIKMGHPRKRRRTNDPLPKTAPYSSAVDVWSLGAVIYHLISAKPPWSCSGDSINNIMCETIMRTPMPLEPLQSAGVSKEGIGFLRQMLEIDPNTRTTMQRCLNHAWIDVDDIYDMRLQPEPIPPELGSIQEDDEENDEMRDDDGNELEDSKLSQLSLHEQNREAAFEGSDEESSLQVEEISHGRQSKRFRREPDIHSSSDSDYNAFPMPDANEIGHGQNRLFGEIGNSALRSSGVFDQDAHRALGVPLQRRTDSPRLPNDYHQSPVTTDDIAQHQLEHFHPPPHSTSAASSLLGAEAQIGKINIASPQSISSIPADPASPWTNSQLSDSIGPGSKPASQTEAPGNQPSISRRTKVAESHRASTRQPPVRDPASARGTSSTPARAIPSASSTQAIPPILGALSTVPASEITTTISLNHRITTWGREPDPVKCNNTWPDNMDSRIPRIAFDITFWRAGIERDEAANPTTFNWLSLPEKEISTVITTRSSKGISVNGVRLVRQDDNGQNLFGFLRTGDVVVVWEKGGKKIAFEVEIGYGVCKARRKEGETFVVERDTYFFGKARGAGAGASGAATATTTMATTTTGNPGKA